ncbi:MAG: DUF4870 domain-containing protein [Planctomycetota bacterium]
MGDVLPSGRARRPLAHFARHRQCGFVAEQGRRAVNFQLSMLLYGAVGAVICLITLVAVPLIPVVFFVVGLVDLIFVLIAAVHVNAGEHYRYPLTIRFFK